MSIKDSTTKVVWPSTYHVPVDLATTGIQSRHVDSATVSIARIHEALQPRSEVYPRNQMKVVEQENQERPNNLSGHSSASFPAPIPHPRQPPGLPPVSRMKLLRYRQRHRSAPLRHPTTCNRSHQPSLRWTFGGHIPKSINPCFLTYSP